MGGGFLREGGRGWFPSLIGHEHLVLGLGVFLPARILVYTGNLLVGSCRQGVFWQCGDA